MLCAQGCGHIEGMHPIPILTSVQEGCLAVLRAHVLDEAASDFMDSDASDYEADIDRVKDYI